MRVTPHLLSARRLAPAVALAGSLVLGACATEEPGISPHRDRFYFPTGITLDPSRELLYVTNSNADLMYNGGTILALDIGRFPQDLSRIAQAVAQGRLDCKPARTDSTSWECKESQFAHANATLRIGSFPSGIQLSSDGRLFVPTRGDDYLLWANVVDLPNGGLDLRCNDDPETGCGGVGTGEDCSVWDCDGAHRVDYSESLRQSLPSEPFGILLNELVAAHVDAGGVRRTCRDGLPQPPDCDCGAARHCVDERDTACCQPPPSSEAIHIYLAHLLGGEVSLFTTSRCSGDETCQVTLQDIRGNFFATHPKLGIQGGYSLAAKTPGDPAGPIYVSSRVDTRLASFFVRDNHYIVDDSRVLVGAIYPGADNRDLAFAPGGDTLYVVNRQPPSLLAIDMTLEDGLPKEEVVWVEEVCGDPSMLRLDPQGDLAYVVCFGTAQIYVVDIGLGQVVEQITTGKGPNELVLDPARKRAFVANFLENTVGIIDLDPTHTTYRRMVVRIGLVENLVRN